MAKLITVRELKNLCETWGFSWVKYSQELQRYDRILDNPKIEMEFSEISVFENPNTVYLSNGRKGCIYFHSVKSASINIGDEGETVITLYCKSAEAVQTGSANGSSNMETYRLYAK